VFPWAKFRRRKGAVKLHTLIDLHGNIPCFIHITDGKTNDVNALDELVPEPAAFYMMDRGYVDFRRLHRFTESLAFFVIRAKRNLDYARRSRRRIDKSTGLRSDQTIVLQGPKTSLQYPAPLRRISYHDADTDKRFVFLTNNFLLPAITIPQLYKCRWQVELFFKWIKQHLRIKAFYGTSPNAVRTQVWISISVYVLVAILKKELNLDRRLSEILQILSITLFEKSPLFTVLNASGEPEEKTLSHKQLTLFDI
jgi:transposase